MTLKSLLTGMMMLLATAGWAQDIVTIDDIRYLLDDATHTASVKGGGGWGTSGITIPETIEAHDREYAVTSIADSAFISSWSLTGIDIAPSITRIGSYAFKDCSRLSFADIPASVKTIGESAFRGCSSLSQFVVDANNPSYCAEEGVLYNKRKTLLIQCPVSFVGEFNAPEEVREIAPYAFYKCSKIWSVYLYNKVETIGDHAFDKNESLISIYMGTGMKNLGSYALDNCEKLRDIYCQAAVPPTANDKTFDYDWIEYSKLHVPSGSVSAYQKARPWNWTEEVVAMTQREIEVDIEQVSQLDMKITRRYTLNGQKISTPRGIHIVERTDGSKRIAVSR